LRAIKIFEQKNGYMPGDQSARALEGKVPPNVVNPEIKNVFKK
jgi:hypothetical protein